MDIFVFGSNREGIHGKGAAAHARQHWGAEIRVGEGRTGRAYALPTKSTPYKTLDLEDIRVHVDRFLYHARQHPQDRFLLTRIGCGYAGHREAHIAGLFLSSPENVVSVDEFGVIVGPASAWMSRLQN